MLLIRFSNHCFLLKPEMKIIAAYLLAVLGGNQSPSAADLKKILGSGLYQSQFNL